MTDDYLKNYISLKEASELCSYSQEYLSLRARQGKLKSVKIGRNWVTKKEWLESYISDAEEYKINNNHSSLSIKNTESVIEKELEGKELFQEIKSVPENLPAGDFDEFYPAKIVEIQKKNFALRMMSAQIILSLLLITVSIFIFKIATNKNYLQAVLNEGSFYTHILVNKSQGILEETKISVESFIIVAQRGQISDLANDTIRIFKDYSGWLKYKVYKIAKAIYESPKNIVEKFNSLVWNWRKSEKIVQTNILPRLGEKEGTVVIPSTQDDELMKEKIKANFSDEVKVSPVDKSSGIVVPVFKEREGDKYMYVLVPVNK
ncbi:MAG: hypothetical protein PHI53_02290 [Candidatus Pacebacteria bacterium]|nr:hypothetical protein [Candidatus Paceibacterota bacterium]